MVGAGRVLPGRVRRTRDKDGDASRVQLRTGSIFKSSPGGKVHNFNCDPSDDAAIPYDVTDVAHQEYQ